MLPAADTQPDAEYTDPPVAATNPPVSVATNAADSPSGSEAAVKRSDVNPP
jgi:hypothetical protein